MTPITSGMQQAGWAVVNPNGTFTLWHDRPGEVGERQKVVPAYIEVVPSASEGRSGEPVAWIVHADYPFVTMDPPIEGGLPRTPLYRQAHSAREPVEYICKCGVRVSPHRCSTGTDF